uniref:tRNA (uracil-O(2)-)-methyltransferase n=1 Tax=Mesocestoides corti TaxID=53468 RepID=A0A5K3FVZ0_MESCO
MPRFVDVGCGNGLLVFLLISEGYEGIGIDVRKRSIWDQFPDAVKKNLIEKTLNPQTHPGFPEATWLIGNHSDELTPWLPVLATRSNHHCCAFVIPCCPFSLFHKFDAGKHRHHEIPDVGSEEGFWRGRYREYVAYLQGSFETCGFVPEVDILRIPSTKRLCIIGRELRETTIGWEKRKENVEAMVLSECGTQFKPRERDAGQSVGCLSAEEREIIGMKVFKRLLQLCPPSEVIQTYDGRRWNPGGCLSLKEASQMIDPTLLAKMKLFKGGLQAVLRSQHQTFMVTGAGIRLRFDPSRQHQIDSVKSDKPRKTKRCWMEANHPDGCPYPPSLCYFAHESEQLLIKQTPY